MPRTRADTQRHWLTEPEDWWVDHLRQRHTDALYRDGEWCVFVLMWHVDDFRAGLVAECLECRTMEDGTARVPHEDVYEVYKQHPKELCSSCLGTRYEGGYKAKIVRPALFDFREEQDREGRRGESMTQQGQVQSTEDFRMRNGDYILRGDGTRWQVQNNDVDNLITGFQTPSRDITSIAWNYAQVQAVHETDVAFLIEPSAEVLQAQLANAWMYRHPSVPDFSALEDIVVANTLDSGGGVYPASTLYPHDDLVPRNL